MISRSPLVNHRADFQKQVAVRLEPFRRLGTSRSITSVPLGPANRAWRGSKAARLGRNLIGLTVGHVGRIAENQVKGGLRRQDLQQIAFQEFDSLGDLVCRGVLPGDFDGGGADIDGRHRHSGTCVQGTRR